jgi:polyisoprenoid-binding protein YceI
MTITDSPVLTSGTWAIEPAHSEVGFTVRHLGLSKVRGRFNRFSGEVVIADDLATARVTARIDLSSVDTNNTDRDAHLRTGDFFDAETRPEMVFVSTNATESSLQGELTIGGVTKPVSLDVEFHGVAVDGYETTRAGFSATGTISRSDWGIDFNAPLGVDGVLVSDKVALEFEIQLVPAGA